MGGSKDSIPSSDRGIGMLPNTCFKFRIIGSASFLFDSNVAVKQTSFDFFGFTSSVRLQSVNSAGSNTRSISDSHTVRSPPTDFSQHHIIMFHYDEEHEEPAPWQALPNGQRQTRKRLVSLSPPNEQVIVGREITRMPPWPSMTSWKTTRSE